MSLKVLIHELYHICVSCFFIQQLSIHEQPSHSVIFQTLIRQTNRLLTNQTLLLTKLQFC